VETDHENAEEFLERDVRNLVGYFRRKHPDRIGEVDVQSVARALREGGFESVREHQ
jgi:RIO kinase 2